MTSLPLQRLAFVAFLVWLAALIYISSSLWQIQRHGEASPVDAGIGARLESALKHVESQYEELRRQNDDLKRFLSDQKEKQRENADKLESEIRQSRLRKKEDNKVPVQPVVSVAQPRNGDLYSFEHEETRRLLDNRIWELFFYVRDQLRQHEGLSFANHTTEQLYSLLALSAKFSEVDKASEWRRDALQNLTNKIQKRILELQNPKDCSSTRALVCTLNKGCGFGCQLHHVAYCFVVAFGTNRTLILLKDGAEWRYSPRGWTAVFQPVTSCKYSEVLQGTQAPMWRSEETSAADRVVSLPIVDGLTGRPPYLPLAFPRQIADALIQLHSNPPLFFISQFLWYLMRSNEDLSKALDAAAKPIPFEDGALVGLQIRRTDKVGTEAAFHSLDEYMEWTEIWFRVQELNKGAPIPRRIYIATDDASVFKEAKERYTNYTVYGDPAVASSAGLNSRYSDTSLYGVIMDIRLLSQCSYLVCTFSSQVCRMGYELMQVLRGDAGENYHSLDDLYYYGGQNAHEQVAVEEHVPANGEEIALQVGDLVGVAGNHWNGFSKGTNRRTGKMGLYPSYKVREKWQIVDFPVF